MSMCSLAKVDVHSDIEWLKDSSKLPANDAVPIVTCGLCRRILEAYVRRQHE